MLTGRSCGSTCAMSLPSSRMRPSSGVSKPASIRSSVVLPQPLGPSSAKNSPALMSSESRSTARKPPNFFTTASMRSSGMSGSSACGAGFDTASPASMFGRSSAMFPASPIAGRTLAADRHRLNRYSGRGHNIIGALIASPARFGR